MPEQSWCAQSLAILTSGQQSRYTPLHAFSFVRGRSGRSSLQQLLADRHRHCVPERVDAFIALSVGRATSWTHSGAFSAYASSSSSSSSGAGSATNHDGESSEAGGAYSSSFTSEVESLYTSLGVRRVRITLYSAHEMANATRRVERDVASRGARAVASEPQRWWHAAASSIPRWSVRWKPHSRMLYLRHVAYMSAIAEGKATGETYAHFLCTCLRLITHSAHTHTHKHTHTHTHSTL